jgi:hypothetical protein
MVQGLVFKHEHGRAKTFSKKFKEHPQARAEAAPLACLYYRPNLEKLKEISQQFEKNFHSRAWANASPRFGIEDRVRA